MSIAHEEFGHWLEKLGLGAHAGTFAENDVGFAAVVHLSDADLKELGLSLGHRRVLQAAVDQLRHGGLVTAPVPPPAMVGEQTGELRQITVMFCDLVGSTELSTRLDPEDLRSLIHEYYSACCRIIDEGGGFVARLVGDGILAYFGYPVAREDSAECAVRAALRIVGRMASEQHAHAHRIDVRIGIATGVSVISDMVGIGFSELNAVLGQTPNLAARIQSLAQPGGVVIADHTRRLAGGFFAYSDQGTHKLKGFDQAVQLWRVVGEAASGTRFDAQRVARADCIGRDQELAVVLEQWALAQQGNCRVVSLVGEAGIGKSSLLRTASQRLEPGAGLAVRLQCSPSQSSVPLHPVIDWLRRDIGVPAADTGSNRACIGAWLGSEATPLDLALMAEFISVPLDAGNLPPPLPPDRKRGLTFDIVLRHLERHAVSTPVLLMIEDAHWMDGASDAYLRALLRRMRDRPLLVIVTSRPIKPGSWDDAAAVSELTLGPLAAADAQQLIRAASQGRELPPGVVEQILARTDGVPLFIEELTATILESGLLREEGGAWVLDAPLPELDIPSTLRDSLMARLDRLNDIKEVARVGSAIGREFSFRLLQQVSERPAEQLRMGLARLVEAHLLFERGTAGDAEYIFKHALVQQAAYDSMLRADRRVLHARIVRAIEAHQPELAHQQPGLMAHHCQLGGLTEREVDYLHAAGVASTRIVAIPEALSYFQQADEAISRLEPDARNARRAIDIILGMMEVGRFAILPSRLVELSARARRLAGMDGVTCDAATLASILFQDGRAKLYTSHYAEAREIFSEIRKLGREQGSLHIERRPASAYAMDLCCQGLFNEMLEFVDESCIDYYKQSGSFIDYISGLGWIGYARCQVGPGDSGVRSADLSVSEARRVDSQIYLAGAYIWRSHALMAVRRFDEAVSDATECVDLADAHAVPYLGWHGLVFLALCQCRKGDLDAAELALERARALLATVEDGRWSLLDYLPAIEAEIACARGRHAQAIACADSAIEIASRIGGHFAGAIAWRAKAVSSLHAGSDPQRAQEFFDRAMQLHRAGAAHAEASFSALVWSHALQACGHAGRGQVWAGHALALAHEHGFDLTRCEHGAAAALREGAQPERDSVLAHG